MDSKIYTCDCGKTFDKSQAFNSHKGSCKTHYLIKYGNLDMYYRHIDRCISATKLGLRRYVENNRIHQQLQHDQWVSEQHRCERCGKIMTEYYGSDRFCSKSCACARKQSEETILKIKTTFAEKHNHKLGKPRNSSPKLRNNPPKYKRPPRVSPEEYYKSPKYCSNCNKLLPYNLRFRSTCSEECLKLRYVTIGQEAVLKNCPRSKNEVAFCNKCEEYFGKENVLHNVRMFNGWDADIILPQYKLAILWNGPWHYRKITKQHSVEQVQNRDKLKIIEIRNCGYTEYIIKDTDKYNINKVEKEFNLLLQYLNIN